MMNDSSSSSPPAPTSGQCKIHVRRDEDGRIIWQRHYRVLADLVDADGSLPGIRPRVLMDGDDIGLWLQRQTPAGRVGPRVPAPP